MDDFSWFVGGLIIGFFACVVLVSVVKMPNHEEQWQRQTVEHNCAAYDSQTGEWDWIDKED